MTITMTMPTNTLPRTIIMQRKLPTITATVHDTTPLDDELERALDVLASRAGRSEAERVRSALGVYLHITGAEATSDRGDRSDGDIDAGA